MRSYCYMKARKIQLDTMIDLAIEDLEVKIELYEK